uniref:G_PROTEIN_RECEP_F1_2 domain-containing protein n=1 Tax=Steinernema glaseri TaxID=37863 RepID=A0A1I7ZL32_9BILA
MYRYAIVINYSIQISCAVVTLLLNPITLCGQFLCKTRKDQFSMLFTHVVFHTVFALSTLLWAGAVLLHEDKELTVWAGILHVSLHPTVGLIDLFVAVDRLLTVTYPLAYMIKLRKRLVIVAIGLALAICTTLLTLYRLTVKEQLTNDINMINYVSPEVMKAAYILNTSMILANIIASLVFLAKLRRFLEAQEQKAGVKPQILAKNCRYAKLANTIVMYQIVLEALFWVFPSMLKVIMEYVLYTNLTKHLGPITLTTFSIYVASCSLLYWKKLRLRPLCSAEATPDVAQRRW